LEFLFLHLTTKFKTQVFAKTTPSTFLQKDLKPFVVLTKPLLAAEPSGCYPGNTDTYSFWHWSSFPTLAG